MVARNCDFNRLADSADILASASSLSRSFKTETSEKVSTMPPSERPQAATRYQEPPISISRISAVSARRRRISGEMASTFRDVDRNSQNERPNGNLFSFAEAKFLNAELPLTSW